MSEPDRSVEEIWIHALGAKVGGGVTYLRAILPEIVELLDGRGVRVVLLLPEPIEGVPLPDWVETRALPHFASSHLRRLVFDQVILPAWLVGRRGTVLYCSGSFAPVVKPARTVALVRNAIYFDDAFLRLESPGNRALLRLQGRLIALGARGCAAVHYPSRSMRELVEARHPGLRPAGAVNLYGVAGDFARARRAAPEPAAGSDRIRFLYVMNYTLQKNLGYLLEALALARASELPVRVVLTSRLEEGSAAWATRDRALIEEHDLVESGYLTLAGPAYGPELIELYTSVDACVFPSICESFGHPLVEAMAAGKPLVCADRPYARELCGEHAIYVDPERPEDLVEVWRRWPEIVEVWQPVPIEWLERRFSWPQHVTRLFESLLARATERERPIQELTQVK